MCILEFRPLLLAWGAVAASALAPQLASAQRMSRPQMTPNAASMSSFNGFRSPSFGMMASTGMSAASSSGTGSRGNSSGMGGYGGGTSGSSNGAQGGTYGTDTPENGDDSGARSETPPKDRSLSRVLTATAVPNDGGRLLWPVGLRVLRGGATEELRRQIDALFEAEAEQTQTGPVNPQLAKELAESIDVLRTFLARDREERFSLPLTLYEDAESFLARLDHAQKRLQRGLEPLGGKVRPEARKGNADEVGLSDNHFEPPLLVVFAGTTVRWTNHGQHKHTVTSDNGGWGSEGLSHEGVYSYTFPNPGTYTYHCEVHPAEMRGTIVVK